MKNIILLIIIISSSCTTAIKEPSTPVDPSSPNYLEELDKKYPDLPIKLNPFVVEDRDSNGPNEDHIRARKIDIKEKEYMLRNFDLMRFVVNTPEFKAAVLDPVYKFRAGRTATGTYGSIREGDYYNKTKLLALLKYASITTFIVKTDVSTDAVAQGLAGPSYYVCVDLLNNPSRGPWDTVVNILFPNRDYWANEDIGYGKEFPDNRTITALMLHELMHNLGTKHGKSLLPHPEDTATGMQDIFMATTGDRAWQNKYRQEIKAYKYYQTKYKDWLTFTTTPTKVNVKQTPTFTSDTYNSNMLENYKWVNRDRSMKKQKFGLHTN